MKTTICVLSAVIGISMFFSCKKDPDFPVPNDPGILMDSVQTVKCQALNGVLDSASLFTSTQPVSAPMVEGQPVEEVQGDHTCVTRTVTWAPEFSEHYIIQPFTEVIYPGALIDGNTILTGSYRPIISDDRDTITLSMSLWGSQGGSASIQVPRPSNLSEVRAAISQMLMQAAPNLTQAFINFEIEEVRSEKEAELKLAAHFKGWGAKISGSYGWSNTEVKTRYLVKFYQIYYSIDMDIPAQACQFFDPVPSPEEASDMFEGSNPVYVSSVKYGRMVYFMVESSYAEQEVEKALEVAFSKWGKELSVDFSQRDKEVLENSTIKALIIGGSADGAVQVFTDRLAGLENFIVSEAEYSANSQGAPLAYTLRFLKDNSVATVVLPSSYTVQDCFVTCPQTVAQFGSFGGNGGAPFNNLFPPCAKVKSIQVRSAERVDAIKIAYEYEGEEYTISEGGLGGSESPVYTVTSPIVRIEGRSGNRLDRLRFVFADGSATPWYGGGGGSPFTVDLTGEFSGIWGRSGDEIDALGIYQRVF
jgi:thiol-activated cytolysin